MTTEEPIRRETLLGDILKAYPSLRGRVGELFGAGCLQCRASRVETIAYTSWHKGLDPDKVCRELNRLLKGN